MIKISNNFGLSFEKNRFDPLVTILNNNYNKNNMNYVQI